MRPRIIMHVLLLVTLAGLGVALIVLDWSLVNWGIGVTLLLLSVLFLSDLVMEIYE